MNLVLIPCWHRDDFLSVTLENIIKADKSDQNQYIFLLDRGYSLGVLQVANSFKLNKIIRKTPMHRFNGNTYNLLEGYKYALTLTQNAKSNLIYMIEEDIWVGKDFFTFHENVQNKFDSFVVSGVKNQNDKRELPSDTSLVYYHKNFQSLGLSWKPEKLHKVIKHALPQYYGYMLQYIKRQFPKSSLGDSWSEQDGLVNRICEQDNLKCLYPYVGRAYHAGFVGYNRPGNTLTGSLEERVNKLKSMNESEMNEMAREYKDIKKIDLSGHDVKEFILAE